ncbi:MAG TPA: ABC transporter permease [bacterium]|nr:ABC transporter permease [bacterium]
MASRSAGLDALAPSLPVRAAGRRRGPWQRFLRNPRAILGAGLMLFFVVVAVAAPRLAPFPPDQPHIPDVLHPPGAPYLLGADQLGRDILSRIIIASRVSLAIGVLSMLVSIVLGTFMGALAGFFGGHLDGLLMRLTDMVIAIPVFFLTVAFLALFGPSIPGLIWIIGLTAWPPTARLVRAEFLTLRARDFVAAAHATGASNARIIIRHILPNVVPVIVISATLRIGLAILTEAGLSFLGLGVQPPRPSWGNIIADGRAYLGIAWWVSLFPGLCVFLAVMAFNLLGDGLRDAFDPKLQI